MALPAPRAETEPAAEENPPAPPLLAELTDASFERYWKAGALKYRHFRPLAEGGTATLELCTDANLGREVVFKSLHPHLADDEGEQQRFLREARVTALHRAPRHGARLRAGPQGRRQPVLHDEAPARARPPAAADGARGQRPRPRAAVPAAAADRHRDLGGQHGRPRAQPRRHPPRPQTRERAGGCFRADHGARLGPRQGARGHAGGGDRADAGGPPGVGAAAGSRCAAARVDPAGPPLRHAAVHVARAGPRRRRPRRADRCLQPRERPLRDADAQEPDRRQRPRRGVGAGAAPPAAAALGERSRGP